MSRQSPHKRRSPISHRGALSPSLQKEDGDVPTWEYSCLRRMSTLGR